MGNENVKDDPKTSHEKHTSSNPDKLAKDLKEQEALAQFQVLYPSHNSNDLLRFLRARDLNVKHAAEMYSNFLNWQATYKPSECAEKIFRELLSHGKIYVLSISGENPILYFIPREHDPDIDDYKKVVRFGCCLYELMIKNHKNPGTAEVICIVNCTGSGFKNVDLKLVKTGINFYQNYFPERLQKCYVYGLPPSLTTFWNFIENLLDDRTRGKIFLLKKSQYEEIFGNFPKEILPEELGGKNQQYKSFTEELFTMFYGKQFSVEFGKEGIKKENCGQIIEKNVENRLLEEIGLIGKNDENLKRESELELKIEIQIENAAILERQEEELKKREV